jgi:uncharacterized repeat protein (TIGR01451 family)
MAIFFASGNSGADGVPGALDLCTGGDGVIDPDSLYAPGTAKNVITVGAAESQRDTGGLSEIPWLLLSFCFATQPIATDLPSDNPDGLAAFSSRGPADDGRVKPDLVAPGTNIISNRSHYPNAGLLWGEYDANYVYSGGTSMATPLAAGAGVLARQWLTLRGLANPSAAAVKVLLLDTTYDIAPGQYGTGSAQEIPFNRPNSMDGWGRADLGFLDAPAPYMLWVDDHAAGLATHQTVSYAHSVARPLEVLSSAQPLRIMLAWTDPPASLSASKQLVNDLDLTVIGPGNVTYHGNDLAAGDRTNNVEGIVIENPPVGQYSVQVRGRNVPIGSQPYALAVGGPIAQVGQLALAKTAKPAEHVRPGGLITYTLALNAGNRPIAQTVALTDALPLHTTFAGASGGGALAGGLVEWSIPSLAANQTVTRTLTVRVDDDAADGTPIVNGAYRADNGIDLPGVGQPVVVAVDAAPAPGTLALSKTAGRAVATAGGLITYTLSIGARGGPVGAVVLSDTLPISTTFVGASGSFTRAGPGGNSVVWPLGDLAAEQTVTRTLTVRIAGNAPDGLQISNVAYRATASNAAPVDGAPVRLTVGAPPPALDTWLPIVAR